MENAADALKMAGAVLIFVLAISIIILAFSQVRETSDTIMNYKDRETSYYDFYQPQEGLTRNVGLETILPSIFRVYIENYKIVFENLKYPIYIIDDKDGNEKPIRSIDGEYSDGDNQNQGVYNANSGTKADNNRTRFLRGIVFGRYGIKGQNGYEGDDNKSQFERDYGIKLTGCKPIYEQLYNKGTSITERVGIYTQSKKQNDINLTKRIITYYIPE